jgi:hypothetical protein
MEKLLHLKIKNNFDLDILLREIEIYREVIIEGLNENTLLYRFTINLMKRSGFNLLKNENSSSIKFAKIKKIAFHIYFFCVRGTSTALFDYAHYSESILGCESIFVAPKSSIKENKNVDIALQKFQKRFKIFYYDDMRDLDNILEKENCDMLYVIKYGSNDGVFSNKIKTCVHCVFDMSQPHGDVYAGVSEQIASKFGNKIYVPHMVIEPFKNSENLREELGIPKESTVFGYHGGSDSFNIHFAINAVKKASRLFTDIYFLFVNIPRFDSNNPKIIFLNKIVEIEDKSKFINTCDCCLEAQSLGQSFGLSLSDFSVNNKPIITYGGVVLNDNYKKILGNKAMYYYDEKGLIEILKQFNKEESKNKDLNCYKEYSPEKVMKIFKSVFCS